MAVRKYNRDELLHLRNSPLVQRPEKLPPIEQWLEFVYADGDPESKEKLRLHRTEASQPRKGLQKGGEGTSPMGNFSTGARPMMPRSRTGGAGDDISLGPPKTMFPSSRNVTRLADFGEKSESSANEEQEAPKSRFFGDKSNRKSVNEKDRDGLKRESWTSARERRAMGGEEETSRYPRRDRDQDGERRNGYGEKHDPRWTAQPRQNGDRTSWRDREHVRKEREFGHSRAEKAPEWMDDPAPEAGEDDLRSMGMPKSQADFQKWKEAMSGKKQAPSDELEAQPLEKEAAPTKMSVPLKLEGIVDKPFGGLSSMTPADSATTPGKSATAAKGKGSRFASYFHQPVPQKEETPPALPETNIQKQANAIANGSAEDEAGFKRILDMLGGTTVGSQSAPTATADAMSMMFGGAGLTQNTFANEGPSSPPPQAKGGSAKKSRFTGFFDQNPAMSPEPQPRQKAADVAQGTRSAVEEPLDVFGGRLHDDYPTRNQQQPSQPSKVSPDPAAPTNGNQRANDNIFIDQPPSRGAATPDINIQNLLASQRAQRPQGQDKNSEFLLNLLQTKGSRPPSQQAIPQSLPNSQNSFPLWLDQPPHQQQHTMNVVEPKPRAPPPPGMFEDHLLRSVPPERQDQPPRPSQRAPPPGFIHDQQQHLHQQAPFRQHPLPPQQQQHQQPSRAQLRGHPQMPPQMQIPQPQQRQFGGTPQDFLQSPSGPGPGPPPPGFNQQHIPRQAYPPGFHGQNMGAPFQQHAQRDVPPQSAGGFISPPNNGAPPGFFAGGPPPGFPGGQQLRSPTEHNGLGGMRTNGRFDVPGGFDVSRR